MMESKEYKCPICKKNHGKIIFYSNPNCLRFICDCGLDSSIKNVKKEVEK